MPTTDLATVRSLSQYRPFERGGASAREAQEDLLLACLAESGGSAGSLPQLTEDVETLFNVRLHQAEVERAVGQLLRDERVERRGAVICLTEAEQERLNALADESKATAATALAEWRVFLLGSWPGLTAELIEALEQQLQKFLRAVFQRHGAEAAVLLYPEEEAAADLYAELEESFEDFLGSAEPEVEAIREAALSHFIRRPSEAQRQYLGQNLNTAYHLTLLSIDPEGAQLVREIASGQWVYLDTNFLYRVLGIQGPRHVRAARTILETTTEVGYRCCVTPWTVEEFKYSLDNARRYLHRYPVPPSDYADLLAEATSDEDFVTAYWREVKDSPVEIDDFYAHWREVESHLERLGIEIRSEGCQAIEQQTELVTDEVSILAKALHGRYRRPELLTHDVQHRLLVRRLRGVGNRTFANAGYWFLTFDTVLPQSIRIVGRSERRAGRVGVAAPAPAGPRGPRVCSSASCIWWSASSW